MGAYFKPWRRKIGVVTLAMACVCLFGWIRSIGRQDFIHFCPSRALVSITSRQQSVCVCWSTYLSHEAALSKSNPIFYSPLKRFNFGHMSEKASDDSNVDYWLGPASAFAHAFSQVGWLIGDFALATESHTTLGDENERVFLFVPYWSIVLPLTLLSAWLLLSKPRAKKTAEKPT